MEYNESLALFAQKISGYSKEICKTIAETICNNIPYWYRYLNGKERFESDIERIINIIKLS
jgi:hypothetical protein